MLGKQLYIFRKTELTKNVVFTATFFHLFQNMKKDFFFDYEASYLHYTYTYLFIANIFCSFKDFLICFLHLRELSN